jgi:hypothetical protein
MHGSDQIELSPCVAVSSPVFSPMASKGSTDASKVDKGTVGEEEPIFSIGLTSESDVGSEDSDASGDTGDSGNASDDGARLRLERRLPWLALVLILGYQKLQEAAFQISKALLACSPRGLPDHLA